MIVPLAFEERAVDFSAPHLAQTDTPKPGLPDQVRIAIRRMKAISPGS
jgi:hypothetical protein